MSMVSGGQLVARMLKKEGVRHVFTLSGLHVAPIYAACVEEGISLIDTRHEQAAAHAADAYARLTRGMGVAVVTAGPGVTDALTGVANAYAASSPMLLLGGAAPTFNQGRGALQEMEQVDLFHRISKWSDRVPSPEAVPHYLAKAFRVARSGRPGPVFLELAWDVLCNGVDAESLRMPERYRTDARVAPDPRKVDEALALLRAAERPAILAGSSIWWDGAWEALRGFAERAQVPVFLNGAGRGCLPAGHPLFFQHSRKEALSGADVVFVIGTPFDFRLNYGSEPTFGVESKIVQVDIDPTELGRNRPVDVGLIADSFSALSALADGADVSRRDALLSALRESETRRQATIDEWARSDSTPIHHYRLAKELSDVANAAGQDPVFIADGGNWVAMAAKVLELKQPGRWLDPGPLGCLGVGAPFALASKVLHPERTCWVVQGDGSFGLNGFDFETAVRFRLPMVCVVGNDAAWGQIRLPQVQMFGEDKSPATLLAPTRYDKVVEAFGGHGEYVTEPAQIRPALERALASGTVACVNVLLDPDAPVKAGAMGYAV
ncbi:thiamine pyrophosphate-binding protein [Pyxidicoccus xibeiensis]|uniref:thiamine pyrophosphate-binding protein n=1 Tax=Pyxidicoccus xibeiensis TaxID=2906759 RepID=UPI0020A7B56B|nr:thiamine pyrophosphate-binding protein [Pyxidicoccus xibeiensis]MCP3142574.1 thiamine pyrophosphate-dependent enzyme [Pyxidicoccus xibeiensis]